MRRAALLLVLSTLLAFGPLSGTGVAQDSACIDCAAHSAELTAQDAAVRSAKIAVNIAERDAAMYRSLLAGTASTSTNGLDADIDKAIGDIARLELRTKAIEASLSETGTAKANVLIVSNMLPAVAAVAACSLAGAVCVAGIAIQWAATNVILPGVIDNLIKPKPGELTAGQITGAGVSGVFDGLPSPKGLFSVGSGLIGNVATNALDEKSRSLVSELREVQAEKIAAERTVAGLKAGRDKWGDLLADAEKAIPVARDRLTRAETAKAAAAAALDECNARCAATPPSTPPAVERPTLQFIGIGPGLPFGSDFNTAAALLSTWGFEMVGDPDPTTAGGCDMVWVRWAESKSWNSPALTLTFRGPSGSLGSTRFTTWQYSQDFGPLAGGAPLGALTFEGALRLGDPVAGAIALAPDMQLDRDLPTGDIWIAQESKITVAESIYPEDSGRIAYMSAHNDQAGAC